MRVVLTACVILSGAVTATTGPVGNREVTWFSRPSGGRGWQRRGAITTSSTGGFRVAVKPVGDTEYRFRLPASPGYRATTSTAMVSTYTVATTVAVTSQTAITAGDPATLHVMVMSGQVSRAGVTDFASRSVAGEIATDRLTNELPYAFARRPSTTSPSRPTPATELD